MTTEPATRPANDAIERVLINGDLSALNEAQRLSYYQRVCESVGLNPLTKPFEYLLLKGQGNVEKLVLYATRACTDQLRSVYEVAVEIVDRKVYDGVYVVTARAKLPGGRTDESTGAVPLEREGGSWQVARSGKRFFQGDGTFHRLRGEALANAYMKAETKAKRRVTLSICGLGVLDESEVESVPGASRVRAEGPQPKSLPAAAPAAPTPRPEPAAGRPNTAPEVQPLLDWLDREDEAVAAEGLCARGQMRDAVTGAATEHLGPDRHAWPYEETRALFTQEVEVFTSDRRRETEGLGAA